MTKKTIKLVPDTSVSQTASTPTSFKEFLRRKQQVQKPTDETKKAIKLIMDQVVCDAYAGLTLQACMIVSNKAQEPSDDCLNDVMDRLHKAFFNLADLVKPKDEEEETEGGEGDGE